MDAIHKKRFVSVHDAQQPSGNGYERLKEEDWSDSINFEGQTQPITNSLQKPCRLII